MYIYILSITSIVEVEPKIGRCLATYILSEKAAKQTQLSERDVFH